LTLCVLKIRPTRLFGVSSELTARSRTTWTSRATGGGAARVRSLSHPLFHTTGAFRELLKSSGVKTVKLPARSPNLNAYAERFVRSIKSECLAQIIPLGDRHLRKAVKQYTKHYHFERNHQGLNNELIEKPSDEPSMDGAVECQERLGGVLKYC